MDFSNKKFRKLLKQSYEITKSYVKKLSNSTTLNVKENLKNTKNTNV